MAYTDKTLNCQECGQSYTFSADDQAYHAQKGYTNEPKRCPSCRQSRRAQRSGDSFGGGSGGYSSGSGGFSSGSGGFSSGYDRAPREMHPAVCADCGKETTVPFRPRGDRPVYCSDCYSKHGGRSQTSRY